MTSNLQEALDRIDVLEAELKALRSAHDTLRRAATMILNATEEKPKEKRSKYAFSSDDMETADFIRAAVERVIANPIKVPNMKAWANEIRLMRQIDGRKDEDIRDLMDWASRDPFWSTNVLSPKKLRKQWDRLWLQSRKARATPRSIAQEAEEQARRISEKGLGWDVDRPGGVLRDKR